MEMMNQLPVPAESTVSVYTLPVMYRPNDADTAVVCAKLGIDFEALVDLHSIANIMWPVLALCPASSIWEGVSKDYNYQENIPPHYRGLPRLIGHCRCLYGLILS